MKPFFTIITPTILRPSLQKMCETLDAQRFYDWQHLIYLDRKVATDDQRTILLSIEHPQREVIPCDKEYCNFGNTPRNLAWNFATGKYLLYIDDDNFLMHDDAFSDLATEISDSDYPDWGIFPMWRHGRPFFHDPPRSCYVDTANLYVKREIGRWPDIDAYTADGILIEELISHPEYSYKALPDVRPMINMPYSSEGR
jgi:hypothetical protein